MISHMRRRLLVAIAIAVVPWAIVRAQDIPDFSGKWTAVIAKPTGREVLALGDTFTVTQIDTILQLEVPGSKRTLIIDGMAHEVRMPGEAPARPTARGGAAPPIIAPTRVVTTNRSMTTTSVQDGALKVVTIDTETVTEATTPPTSTETRKTTSLVWRLQPDGTLLIERTTASTSSAGGRSAPASIVKTTYSRAGR
jgi:hypothetical protein